MIKKRQIELYNKMLNETLCKIGLKATDLSANDVSVNVKSRASLNKYDDVKYFSVIDSSDGLKGITTPDKKIKRALTRLEKKKVISSKISKFLSEEIKQYESKSGYEWLKSTLATAEVDARTYNICVTYTTPAGYNSYKKRIIVSEKRLKYLLDNPESYMSTRAYKQQLNVQLIKKRKEYIDKVNKLYLLICDAQNKLIIATYENLLSKQREYLVNNENLINNLKTYNAVEWISIDKDLNDIQETINSVIEKNTNLAKYYESSDFTTVKQACSTLMDSQHEFNEYIQQKVDSISNYFGIRISRTQTENQDKYHYARAYKKDLAVFTAEVSSTVFSSAENDPIKYVVKYFYPDRDKYTEAIEKLQYLIEELETLKDAKTILNNNKQKYQQYLQNVPDFVLQYDEAGFYARLGFADISEAALTVEYKFTYTSNGGMAQRNFSVPMTEDTIKELISALQNKLTYKEFAKEQRNLMTEKLRNTIKKRDNFTCCNCGNSISKEPNLLLEIDHIIPVAKGGVTIESNLQTLCWRCNRKKGDKIMSSNFSLD